VSTQQLEKHQITLIQLFLALAFRPLQFHKCPETDPRFIAMHQRFVLQLLSLPYLTLRLPPALLSHFVAILPIVLSFEPSQIKADSTEDQQRLRAVFGNLCGLGKLLTYSVEYTIQDTKSKLSLVNTLYCRSNQIIDHLYQVYQFIISLHYPFLAFVIFK
jgi:hypothetical protein